MRNEIQQQEQKHNNHAKEQVKSHAVTLDNHKRDLEHMLKS
jgi:hypothetical protein